MSDPQDNEENPPEIHDLGPESPLPLAYRTPMAEDHHPPHFVVQMLIGVGLVFGTMLLSGWLSAIFYANLQIAYVIFVLCGLAGAVGPAVYLRKKKGWKDILPAVVLCLLACLLLCGVCFAVLMEAGGFGPGGFH